MWPILVHSPSGAFPPTSLLTLKWKHYLSPGHGRNKKYIHNFDWQDKLFLGKKIDAGNKALFKSISTGQNAKALNGSRHRNQWRAFANTVMNIHYRRYFLSS
jgi:hypothetical protein